MRQLLLVITAIRVALGDALWGARLVFRNTFFMTGLIVAGIALTIQSQPDLRYMTRMIMIEWLQSSNDIPTDINAVERATAIDPNALSATQARVANYLAKKFSIAPEPMAALVKVAYVESARENLEPSLILAVICIESSFHPYAQSPVGAAGLMQVMTRVHRDKYRPFGGTDAAFDPASNIRVGIQVLKEYVKQRGSVSAGLRYYVGAGHLDSDGGYAAKVLQEQALIQRVIDSEPAR
jgi:soluble lytic murein transglycosylase-like protein